jgi:homoserine dehydrogenase
MSETVNVGILGKGTVGSAFKRLLNERADMVEEVSGRRPRVSGVLSRKKGDFERILSRSDIVVELIGGIDPALDYVTRALREGKHVVSANKQLLAHLNVLRLLPKDNQAADVRSIEEDEPKRKRRKPEEKQAEEKESKEEKV